MGNTAIGQKALSDAYLQESSNDFREGHLITKIGGCKVKGDDSLISSPRNPCTHSALLSCFSTTTLYSNSFATNTHYKKVYPPANTRSPN